MNLEINLGQNSTGKFENPYRRCISWFIGFFWNVNFPEKGFQIDSLVNQKQSHVLKAHLRANALELNIDLESLGWSFQEFQPF